MTLLFQRGKRVPVLIPPDAKKALEYIVDPQVRKRAGLKPTNKYMFATRGMNCCSVGLAIVKRCFDVTSVVESDKIQHL